MRAGARSDAGAPSHLLHAHVGVGPQARLANYGEASLLAVALLQQTVRHGGGSAPPGAGFANWSWYRSSAGAEACVITQKRLRHTLYQLSVAGKARAKERGTLGRLVAAFGPRNRIVIDCRKR